MLALVLTRNLFTLSDASNSLYATRHLFFSLSQHPAHESCIPLEACLQTGPVLLHCPTVSCPAIRYAVLPPRPLFAFTTMAEAKSPAQSVSYLLTPYPKPSYPPLAQECML